MSGAGFDLLQWVRDPFHGALSVVVTSGAGYFAHLMWQKVHHKVTGHDAPGPSPPLNWSDNKVAQVYLTDALRRRLQVADGTRIIVTDRAGVLQPVDFPSGQYSAREVAERLNGARVGTNSGAEALQYRTALFDLPLAYSGLRSEDDFFDVEASLGINVRVDPKHPERLMTWRIVTMDRVKSVAESELEPHVKLAVRSLAMRADDFDLRLQEKKAELESSLNARLGQHGFIAVVTALKAKSADCQRDRTLSQQVREQERQANFDRLMRQIRLRKAQGEAESEEAVKAMIQEGRLNDVARMKELDEVLVYKRKWEEANRLLASEARQAEGPRHEVLEELERLRKRRKASSIDLRIVRPGQSRDISVRPPASADRQGLGSSLQLAIASEISGYLYVLNLGTSGKLWRLLPNPWRTDNRIAKQQTVLIPNGDFELKFEGKPGTEVVMAIVVPNRVDQLEQLPLNADGMSLSPEAAARGIAAVGRQLSSLDDWAEATLAIQTQAGQVVSATSASV